MDCTVLLQLVSFFAMINTKRMVIGWNSLKLIVRANSMSKKKNSGLIKNENKIVPKLASRLTEKHGSSFALRNLRRMMQFAAHETGEDMFWHCLSLSQQKSKTKIWHNVKSLFCLNMVSYKIPYTPTPAGLKNLSRGGIRPLLQINHKPARVYAPDIIPE